MSGCQAQGWRRCRDNILGEVAALVLELTVLDRLGLLLGLLRLGSGGSGLGSRRLGHLLGGFGLYFAANGSDWWGRGGCV